MLFNCLQCGRSISSHTVKCPYCSVMTSEIVNELQGMEKKEKAQLKSRYRNTILSMMLKY